MDLVIKQTVNQQENGNSALLDLLYSLTKPDPITGQAVVNNAILVGRISVPAAYEDAVNFLNTRFSVEQDNGSDLQITVLNNNYYIRFADPEAVRVLTEKGILFEGEGLTVAQAALIKLSDNCFKNNVDIVTFNELKYFDNRGSSYTFGGCSSLEEVNLSLRTSIGNQEFQGCTNLNKFNGENSQIGRLVLDRVTGIGDGAFVNCQGLEILDLSQSSITNLGRNFASCHNLEKVFLPSSCISFWIETFERDENLTTINITQVTSISNYNFNGCAKLEFFEGEGSVSGRLNLPNLTGSLGTSAFNGCAKMTSIESLGSITSIGASAFSNCTNLATINFPSTITNVGDSAFKNTAWLNNQPDGVVYINTVGYSVKGTATSTITLNSNTNRIIKSFLSGHNEVTTLVLNEGLEIIAEDALTNNHLQAFHLPSTVNSFGNNRCFLYANAVTVASGNTKYDSRDNCNAIIETSTNKLLSGCPSTVIPNTVTKIGLRAFQSCPFTSITIPNSVTIIESYAFNGCANLNEISIPTSVSTIGDTAFYRISRINITDLGAFCSIDADGNNSTGAVSNLWDGRDGAYADIYLNGTRLISINVPNSVTQILGVFVGTKIESIIIPDSVTLIGSRSFKDCRNLTTIDIGAGLTSIGAYAFERCTNLTSFTIRATTPPTKHSSAFNKLNSNCIFYVPAGSVDTYKSTSGWSDYASRIQAIQE